MNPIYCNKCTAQYNIGSDSDIKNYLWECGHIFCAKCIQGSGQPNQCPICKKALGFIEITKEMDSNMQMFFVPAESVVGQCVKVFNFQMMHRNLLVQNMAKKYNFAKRECLNFYNANKKLEVENQFMRHKLKSLGFNVPPFIASTPMKINLLPNDRTLSGISSIRLTPGSVPGSAQRILSGSRQSSNSSAGVNSFNSGQGRVYSSVPVHKPPILGNLKTASPTAASNLLQKYRRSFHQSKHQ